MRTRSNLSSSEFKLEDIKKEKSGKSLKKETKHTETQNEKQSIETMSPEHESDSNTIHGNDVDNGIVKDKSNNTKMETEKDDIKKTEKYSKPVDELKIVDENNESDKEKLKNLNNERTIQTETSETREKKSTDLHETEESKSTGKSNNLMDLSPGATKSTNLDDSTNKTNAPDNKLLSEFGFTGAISPFPPTSASLFPGHLQSEFAKSLSAQFYNSLSLLASQAMMNVKEEPKDVNTSTSHTSFVPPNTSHKSSTKVTTLQVPPRTDSRSSDGSTQSFDERLGSRHQDPIHRSYSPALSGGASDIILQRPPSGLSPKSLAEQLRNNDSASMVVSRQQKYNSRNPGYTRQPHFPPASEGSPPSAGMFPSPNLGASEPYTSLSGGIPVASGSNLSSSPSLHHFTTRYTIETPADPSRLGVELVLDHDNEEPVIEVECGGNRGLLYVNKLCQGSKGQSIHFGDEWLTPNEFQFISGRETAKDWKRSIRHCGKSLKTLMTKGILQVHPPVCDCNQCRGLHAASKLLPGKKPPQKDINNNATIRNSSPFDATADSDLSPPDAMTRHGFDGGLNSIISQLRKANGFDSTEAQDTLDLSTKSHNNNNKNGNISPNYNSRKRSRNDMSPESRRQNNDIENGRSTSPTSSKRPYARHDEYNQRSYDQSSFAASYPFLSPEEQYRRMLALLNRSMSPSEQQRQIFNMAQSMADPLSMSSNALGGFQALANSLKMEGFRGDKSKSRYKSDRDRKDEGIHSYDPSQKYGKKGIDTPSKRYANSPDKYRKPDRRTPTPSGHRSGEQKFIALESGQRASKHRDDGRSSWPAHKHSTMIELNSGGSAARMPDWVPRSSDRNSYNSERKLDFKSSPNKTVPFNGFFPDNIVLDRIPISKTPVTTLHHRPPSNYSEENDTRRPTGNRQRSYNSNNHKDYRRRSSGAENSGSKTTPMLDLQKHAVPMLSLKRPTLDDLFKSNADRTLGKRLSNNSDQEMKEINDESPSARQSSSAPPPHLSSNDITSQSKRPTSAQGNCSSQFLLPPIRHNTLPMTSRAITSSSFIDGVIDVNNKYEDYLKKRNDEIQKAVDEMRQWSTSDVCQFIGEIDENIAEHVEEFRKHDIDGEGLPLLNEQHLMNIMDIKLGHALKVIARIRRQLKIPQLNTCCHHTLLCPTLSPATKTPTPKSPNGDINKADSAHVENGHDTSSKTENDSTMNDDDTTDLKIDENTDHDEQ
ncbi:uncharacterized protein LOC120340895 [Styela clava]